MALETKLGANGEKYMGIQGFPHTTWQLSGENLGLARAAVDVFQMGKPLQDASVLELWAS